MGNDMDDILRLSALELSAELEARRIGAEELMRATLKRIAAVNPDVNAIVALRDETALVAAARAADNTPRTGWLHGIPMAIKNLLATKDIPTSWGSPLFADFVPTADELPVKRIKAAGAILIGKTNTPEFGLGSHSYNPVHGVTRNPYDLSRSAGGSSGGAGVALATRMLSVADGSDMMGSLRNPAAWNNVYGMRPSHGLVPGDPVGDMILHPLSTLGPMARTPRDLVALLETMAGPDPLQPDGAAFVAGWVTDDLSGKRIGWLGDWGGAYAMEAGILDLCDGALRKLEDLGASVEPVAPLFPADAIWDSWVALRALSQVTRKEEFYADPEKRALLKPEQVWEFETGIALTGADIRRASAIRSDWYRAAARALQSYDALVLPSAQVWPFPAEWHWPKEIAGRTMDTYHRWMEVVIPVSLIGLPAVALPAGFGENGLAGGIQLIGARGNDEKLLAMAQTWHDATNWPDARPPAI